MVGLWEHPCTLQCFNSQDIVDSCSSESRHQGNGQIMQILTIFRLYVCLLRHFHSFLVKLHQNALIVMWINIILSEITIKIC